MTAASDAVMGKQVLRRLCAACAREQRAQEFMKLEEPFNLALLSPCLSAGRPETAAPPC